MLRARYLSASRPPCRRYATVPGPHALVFLEHRAGVIDSGSLSALTAAQQLGGQVTGLVVRGPDEVKGVLEKAKKLKGLNTLLHSASPQYAAPIPEAVSPLLEKLLSSGSPSTHIRRPSTLARRRGLCRT
ncbi:hypothetical protein FOMPIDRAFT_93825 [Fomitopsis schrenkii]|uniref:Electron transfer flavoprotein alpha/beta-subunit N-terminal domain-containing protein n=1 Tax=Fomitopsis schrenkii TaxID=2126942 RepID=S8DKP6_FOMSC|nr:hypothetical protein FOMPIDRAFT_93825 [Fomitopsis schrenkii]